MKMTSSWILSTLIALCAVCLPTRAAAAVADDIPPIEAEPTTPIGPPAIGVAVATGTAPGGESQGKGRKEWAQQRRTAARTLREEIGAAREALRDSLKELTEEERAAAMAAFNEVTKGKREAFREEWKGKVTNGKGKGKSKKAEGGQIETAEPEADPQNGTPMTGETSKGKGKGKKK